MPAITTNWISGKGIILDKNLRDFELFGLVKKGLQPYSSDLGEPVLPPTMQEKKDFLQRAEVILADLQFNLQLNLIVPYQPMPVSKDTNILTPQKKLTDKQKESQKAKKLHEAKQNLKEENSDLLSLLIESRRTLRVFEDPTIHHKTLEEIKLIHIDRIKDVKKLIEDIKEELSKESGNWADYIPRSQEEEKQIIQELLTYIYKVEEVNRLAGPPKIPAQMTTEQPQVKSPKKKLTPVQRHKKQCRKVAKSLWKKNPTMTIADMIQRDEITIGVCEDKAYKEKTIRKWINDLCPNRVPGRRPKNGNSE
ncbi:MAG: hypothetical protein DRP37_02340 [Thermodesulfobacteriota bacterium]|nr:MAG: hypothetical protein DRP37_02340 [Thermodesulfobacteriota bacterium]